MYMYDLLLSLISVFVVLFCLVWKYSCLTLSHVHVWFAAFTYQCFCSAVSSSVFFLLDSYFSFRNIYSKLYLRRFSCSQSTHVYSMGIPGPPSPAISAHNLSSWLHRYVSWCGDSQVQDSWNEGASWAGYVGGRVTIKHNGGRYVILNVQIARWPVQESIQKWQ